MPDIISYPGGKYYAKPYLLPFFPSNTTAIVSPFLGGSHIERALEKQGVVIYGSDHDECLINYYQQIKEDPDRIADLIEQIAPDLDSRCFGEIAECLDFIQQPHTKAALFVIVNRCSYGAMGRHAGYSAVRHQEFIERLAGFINAIREFKSENFHVECCDFKIALEKHSEYLAFIDPPYQLVGGITPYGPKSKNFNHKELAQILSTRKSEWILCYSQTDFIKDLYKNFRIIDLKNKWSYRMRSRHSREILIISNSIKAPEGSTFINNPKVKSHSVPGKIILKAG